MDTTGFCAIPSAYSAFPLNDFGAPPVPTNDQGSPHHFLERFLDDDLIDWLIRETNANAKQSKSFAPITGDEMRCFIAILYLFGYLGVPRRRMLWETSKDCHNSLVADALQRDRFEAILSALFAQDSAEKVAEFLNVANAGLLRLCPVDSQHNIAECSLGRNEVKNRASRLWCGCTKTGYCSFLSYVSEYGRNSAQDVITFFSKLLQSRRPSFYNLLIEDSYCDSDLAGQLRTYNVEVTGARRERAGGALSGIEKLESNVSQHRTVIRGKKLHLLSQIAPYYLDVALSNAWLLYRDETRTRKPLDLLAFRRSIVVYYLQRYARPQISRKIAPKAAKRKNKLAVGDVRYDGIRHYVVPQEKQTRCAKCTMKTTTRCQKCDVGVHVRCFVEFHTKPR